LQWFIGFSEGDGYLFTSKDNKTISFILTQKESNILYHIKDILEIGTVKYDKHVNAFRFIVSDINSIFILAHLFNGNLVLNHRIDQLSKWIKILQSKSFRIEASNLNNHSKISLKNGWLSGFIDSEGCFNVTVKARSSMRLGYRIVMRFLLDQNDQTVLIFISNLLSTGFVSKRSSNMYTYRFTAESIKGFNKLLNYLDLFPLKTIKNESF
jgi:hypothetical protein